MQEDTEGMSPHARSDLIYNLLRMHTQSDAGRLSSDEGPPPRSTSCALMRRISYPLDDATLPSYTHAGKLYRSVRYGIPFAESKYRDASIAVYRTQRSSIRSKASGSLGQSPRLEHEPREIQGNVRLGAALDMP